MAICWWCGKSLTDPFGKPVKGKWRLVDGHLIRTHEVCSRFFDEEAKATNLAAGRKIMGPAPDVETD